MSGKVIESGCCAADGVDMPAAVERAGYATPTLVHDMRVDHGRLHALVAQQFLHGTDVISALE